MSGGVSSDDRNNNRQNTGHQSTEAGLGSSVGADARVAARHEELTKAGFSAEEIAKIAEKVPDLNVKTLQPMAGDSIQGTSADAVQLVKETGCPVVFKFNDTLLVVSQGDSQESVVKAYMEPIEAAHKAYWTPERIAEKDAKEAAFKADMESAFEKLPEFFKKWISESEGKNYGRELDIGIAKDAHLVATTLKTPEAVETWYKLGYERQMQAVPGISDGHAGFSFGQMVRLAHAFLKSESATA
jgi:hypothetical protein